MIHIKKLIMMNKANSNISMMDVHKFWMKDEYGAPRIVDIRMYAMMDILAHPLTRILVPPNNVHQQKDKLTSLPSE